MFWPRSTTVRPAFVFRTLTGRISSILRTGGAAAAISVSLRWSASLTPLQPRSSKPGRVQPGFSSRAS
jgi:hypothetical protein